MRLYICAGHLYAICALGISDAFPLQSLGPCVTAEYDNFIGVDSAFK